MMGTDGTMFFGGGFMWLFWLVLVIVVVALLRPYVSGSQQADPTDALSVLKQRYARGEIDEEEFEKRRNTLL